METVALFTLVGALGLSAMAYATRWLTAGPSRTARVERQGTGLLLRREAMEAAYWCMKPVGTALARMRVSPDALSIASTGIAGLAGFAWSQGAFATGTWLVALAGAFDCFDGMVARLRGLQSESGEVIDSVADRYSELFIFAGLLYHFREHQLGLIATLGALTGGQMISYMTAKAEILGLSVRARTMRRPERFALLLVGGLLSAATTRYWAQDADGLGYPLLAAVTAISLLAHAAALVALREQVRCLKKRR